MNIYVLFEYQGKYFQHFIVMYEICCRFSVTVLIRPVQFSSVLISWIFSGVSVKILDWTTWCADVWSFSIYKNDTLIWLNLIYYRASQVAQWSRAHLLMQEMWVPFLGREDPLRRKWQPTPVFLPGKSQGQRSLASCSPRGRKESEVT